MRNIHEINAALFDSQYEVVHENDYLVIYDRSLPLMQALCVKKESQEYINVLWFIIDNCTISRKEK